MAADDDLLPKHIAFLAEKMLSRDGMILFDQLYTKPVWSNVAHSEAGRLKTFTFTTKPAENATSVAFTPIRPKGAEVFSASLAVFQHSFREYGEWLRSFGTFGKDKSDLIPYNELKKPFRELCTSFTLRCTTGQGRAHL